MTPDIGDLCPNHAVTLGTDESGAADGEQGTHTDVTVTLSILGGETHTFDSAVTIEPAPSGDRVEIQSVPAYIGVEVLGCVVELDADVIATGGYNWVDHDLWATGDTRSVTLIQCVPCPSCGDALDGGGVNTAVGRICSTCKRELESGHGVVR